MILLPVAVSPAICIPPLMTFRSSSLEPPMVFPGESLIFIPDQLLGVAKYPVISVPIRLPVTRFKVLLPEIEIPGFDSVPPLSEIMQLWISLLLALKIPIPKTPLP